MLPLVSPPLRVDKRDHRIFMSWLVTVISTADDVSDPETWGSAGPAVWQARIDKALAPHDVMISPWLAASFSCCTRPMAPRTLLV